MGSTSSSISTPPALAYREELGAVSGQSERGTREVGEEFGGGEGKGTLTANKSKDGKEPFLMSTGGLQIVLQQHFLRENFRNFISKNWCSSNKAEDNSSSQRSIERVYALNCVDFWTDLRDLSLLSASTFQNFRACHIYEKYVLHGAVKQVPTSPNVQDDCHEAFYGERGICNNLYGGFQSLPNASPGSSISIHNQQQQNIGSGFGSFSGKSSPGNGNNIFAAIEVEVLDYLVSVIYPSFEKTSLSMIARKHSHEMMEVIKNGLSGGRRGSLFNSPDKAPLNAIMHKILSDSAYLALFKMHMVQAGRQNELYAYNDIIELKEKLHHIETGDIMDQEIKVSLYMSSVHEFYERYVSLGAACKILVSEATLGDLRYRIGQQPTVIQNHDRHMYVSSPSSSSSSSFVASSSSSRENNLHFIPSGYAKQSEENEVSGHNVDQIQTSELQGAGKPYKELNPGPNGVVYRCDPEALQPIEQDLFEGFIRNHLDTFLASAAYKQVVLSGRRASVVSTQRVAFTLPISPIHANLGVTSLSKPPSDTLLESPSAFNPAYRNINNADIGQRECSAPGGENSQSSNGAGGQSAGGVGSKVDSSTQKVGRSDPQVPTNDSDPLRSSQGLGCGPLDNKKLLSSTDDISSEKLLRKKELKVFIKSGYDHVFGRYLESIESKLNSDPLTGTGTGDPNCAVGVGQLNSAAALNNAEPFSKSIVYMHFYQSASRFQEYYFSNNMDKTAECMYIYERYISRNADEAVNLPADIKNNISKHLLRGNQSIYYEAAEWALDHLSENNWTRFKRYVTDNSNSTSASIREDINSRGGGGGREVTATRIPGANAASPDSVGDAFNSPEFAKLAVQQLDSNSKNCSRGNSDTGTSTHQNTPSTDEKSPLFGKGFLSNLMGINRYAPVASSSNDYSANPSSSSPSSSLPQSVSPFSNDASSVGIGGGSEQGAMGGPPTLSRRLSMSAPRIADSLKDIAHLTNSNNQPGSSHGGGNNDRISFKFDSISKYKNSSAGLRDVLEHPQCCSIFKEFLDRECGSQTLLFLMEIEDYKRIPNPQFQATKARKIFNKYLHDLAIYLVPASKPTKTAIEDRIRTGQVESNLFHLAYDDVLKYVHIYQFSRFQKTPEMNVVVSILSAENKSIKSNRRRSSLNLDKHSLTQAGSAGNDGGFKTDNIHQILQYQSATLYFKDFCIKTYCHENLMFWLDAEYYANLPGSDFMKRTSVKICKKYIFTDARLQINISGPTRAEIIKNVNGNVNRTLFKRAQAEIFKLLETDAFPKFLASLEYEMMKKNLESSQSSNSTPNKGIPGMMNSIVSQLGF